MPKVTEPNLPSISTLLLLIALIFITFCNGYDYDNNQVKEKHSNRHGYHNSLKKKQKGVSLVHHIEKKILKRSLGEWNRHSIVVLLFCCLNAFHVAGATSMINPQVSVRDESFRVCYISNTQ